VHPWTNERGATSLQKNILFSTHFHPTFAAGNRMMEGNGFRSLLFLSEMNTDQQIKTLEINRHKHSNT